MRLRLSSSVIDLNGVGLVKSRYLEKLNIRFVRDMLYTFPRRYDDFSKTTAVADLKAGETATVRGKVKSVASKYGFNGRRRLLRIFVEIEDSGNILSVIWFNLKYLPQQLWAGREIAVAGKVEEINSTKNLKLQPAVSSLQPITYKLQPKYRMRSPVLELLKSGETGTHTGRITPVYPETYGVTSRWLRFQIKQLLPLVNVVPEYLPEEIRGRHRLIGIHTALKEAHFPATTMGLTEALRRLRFDELFFLQLAAQVRRRSRRLEEAWPVETKLGNKKRIVAALPFKLTGAQQKAIDEILADLAKSNPMSRLLQGDVGSGKSAVALVATRVVLAAGYKVLYLAPTEILARQQADSFKRQIGESKVRLLIGALKAREKKEVKERLQGSGAVCVVGTQALLQDDINVKDLALVVVDEQHRFGVRQRKAFANMANSGTPLIRGDEGGLDDSVSGRGHAPHLLSMTATPIPRTLSLTIFGDLDISVLDEMPPGRKAIETKIVLMAGRDEAVTHILEELHRGHQAYVISPLVEQSEKLQVKSAQKTYEEMKQYFPGIAIGLAHGRLSTDEKKGIMNNFAAGAIQLLVATAVVEVGVNVPNATCMIIEGAERFGLAQLHQFRGRIGRGEEQSYCYLFPTTDEEVKNPRLAALAVSNDGFKIAEEDLKLRGPGELYGTSQSGFANLQVASLLDYGTIKITRAEAARLLDEDPELENYPILQKKVEQKNLQTHFE